MRQQTDILIIGQGICGTFLSIGLERAGIPHIVLDDKRPHSASRTAAGLINPVTGRRMVTTWMIGELMAFAREAYGRLEELLGSAFFEPAGITDFFPTAQMRLAFLQRLEEDAPYLRLPSDEHVWDPVFRPDLGFGLISPCYLVDVPGLLDAARARMVNNGRLREERFEREELVVVSPDLVLYKDIEARKIVFCDGIEGFSGPWFSRLPFAPNKGEALIVAIDGFDPDEQGAEKSVFKKGITLVPWREGTFWVGSSYEWAFGHAEPTDAFRHRTETQLREWLRLPFRTLEHLASVRPATLERRPFVGFHPVQPAVGILNGMGTKGCSLAPYFADQLVRHIANGHPLLPEADVRRFSKLLAKTGR
ncbi:MAG TPA: FAD-binding oxidoreductase [Puia sp.]|nr:FAD-binding oxidoreductase [Puia sp.]